jgi:hypothetical protein
MPNPRVFIMGAGFGGLSAVKKLSWASSYVPSSAGRVLLPACRGLEWRTRQFRVRWMRLSLFNPATPADGRRSRRSLSTAQNPELS